MKKQRKQPETDIEILGYNITGDDAPEAIDTTHTKTGNAPQDAIKQGHFALKQIAARLIAMKTERKA